MKQLVRTERAPAAVGAYSQATMTDQLMFTAGQIPSTPDGVSLAAESITVQTSQCLENIAAILDAEGATVADVLKTTVYLADIDDFEEMNEVYTGFFDDEPPARSAFEVAELPKGVGIDIEAVASK